MKILEIAKKYLGENFGRFCKAFGVGCTAWCAAFIAFILRECGVDAPWSMSCTAQRTWWISHGLWHTDRDFKLGDVPYYDWDHSGDCDHVGIIVEINDSKIVVEEGNFGNFDNDKTKVSLRRIPKTYPFICGYARPQYADALQPQKQPVQASEKYVTIDINQVSKGSQSVAVNMLQAALIAHGYSIGAYGIDGDFGNDTLMAVRDFQRNHGLEVDGIVGQQTWNSLLS